MCFNGKGVPTQFRKIQVDLEIKTNLRIFTFCKLHNEKRTENITTEGINDKAWYELFLIYILQETRGGEVIFSQEKFYVIQNNSKTVKRTIWKRTI